MATKTKTYVVDTNVLLSDPNALTSFGKADVVIPLIVLEELDRFKDRQDEVGKNARETIRRLAEIAKDNDSKNLAEGVKLGDNLGVLRIMSTADLGGSDYSLPKELVEKSGDNQIVKFCHLFISKNTEADVSLTTRDLALQLKCSALGIGYENYRKLDVARDAESLYSGAITVVDDTVDFNELHQGLIEYNLSGADEEKAYPNSFVTLTNSSRGSALMRFVKAGQPLRKITEETASKLKPKNKEQKFALDLLFDPSVKLVTLVGLAGSGKAQPLYSKVLTPSGWTTMGEIKAGDSVIGRNGKPTKVISIHPQGNKEIYRVKFSDGSFADCCDDHLWNVKTEADRAAKREWRTLSLREIKAFMSKNKKRQLSIPMVEPVNFTEKATPLAPYLLGALLGDGCMSQHCVTYTSADIEIVEKLKSLLPEDCKISKKAGSKYDYNISKRTTGKEKNKVVEALESLGLQGSKSYEKHIPDIYKYNTVDVRLNVLRGLMDTDGTVSKNGFSTVFYSTSSKLAADVSELVNSLGGKAIVRNKQTSYTYLGEKREGRPSFAVHISMPSNIVPFSLSQKVQKFKPRTKYQPTRYISSVEFVGIEEAKCILVDSSEHLYVTDSYVVTHNTLLSIAAGLEQTIGKHKRYKNLVVCRPVQPVGKEIGFLPGPTPLHTPVLTPNGWTTMGEIKAGDYVIARDGSKSLVKETFDKGRKQVLEILFEDGVKAECCEDHPWVVSGVGTKAKRKLLSAKKLEELTSDPRYKTKIHRRLFIDLPEPVQFDNSQLLPLDSYVLGAILGDGCVSQKYATEFSTADAEMADNINARLPNGAKLKHKSGCSWNFIMSENEGKARHAKNIVGAAINELGLRGTTSKTKFIPEQYMFASIEARIALLQGLMDTDGYVSKDGADVSYATTSKRLANDVKSLVMSLGGFANIRHQPKKFDSYIVSVSFHNKEIKPFLLTRKANLYKSRMFKRRRRIVSVERTNKFEEMKCILIDHPEHLYVMNDYIVTHNTLEEKMEPWIAPIKDNLRFLMTEGKKGKNNEDILQYYFENGIIEVEAMTFIRGRSIANAFMIIDEAQNLNIHELKTILTRAGEGTKIILTGDIEQIDNLYVDSVSNGLAVAVEKFKNETIAGHVSLVKGERSELATIAAKLL